MAIVQSKAKRRAIERLIQLLQSLMEKTQARINKSRRTMEDMSVRPQERGRARYFEHYAELQQMFLRASELQAKRATTRAEIERLRDQKARVAPRRLGETWDEWVLRINEHNREVDVVDSAVKMILSDFDHMHEAIDRMWTIAEQKEWRVPGRRREERTYEKVYTLEEERITLVAERFETFVDALRRLRRKIMPLAIAFRGLLTQIKRLYIPKPIREAVRKLIRVQRLYTYTTPATEKTPEVVAEIRIWYYTWVELVPYENETATQLAQRMAEEAISRIDDDKIKAAIEDLESVETIEPRTGDRKPVFHSLINGKSKLTLDRASTVASNQEVDVIDEDEMKSDVTPLPPETDRVYRAITFFGKYGPKPQPRMTMKYLENRPFGLDPLLRGYDENYICGWEELGVRTRTWPQEQRTMQEWMGDIERDWKAQIASERALAELQGRRPEYIPPPPLQYSETAREDLRGQLRYFGVKPLLPAKPKAPPREAYSALEEAYNEINSILGYNLKQAIDNLPVERKAEVFLEWTLRAAGSSWEEAKKALPPERKRAFLADIAQWTMHRFEGRPSPGSMEEFGIQSNKIRRKILTKVAKAIAAGRAVDIEDILWMGVGGKRGIPRVKITEEDLK
jgi:hypothetical protein